MYTKFANGNKISYDISKYIVDDEEDLTTIPMCNMGSSAYVIHTGESWILDSNGRWYVTTGNKDSIECDCVSELTIWGDLQEPVTE